MQQGARLRSPGNWDISVRTPNIPSMQSGRDSAALTSGTAMTGDNGWAAVGDAAGFIDPLYSPGLDFCSYTSYYVADLLARSLVGEDVEERLRNYNQQYPITYRYWFETLYKDKYYYMGDADLMSAALLLDVSSYYIGLVGAVYRDPECEFLNLPFSGIGGRLARTPMVYYHRLH